MTARPRNAWCSAASAMTKEFTAMAQQVYNDFSAFQLLTGKKPLLVCGSAFDRASVSLPCEYVRFSGFTSNPDYEDVQAGAAVLLKNKCDFIVAFGGGSCIDTAKGIKHLSHADIPLMAVPTTSGTGSEATRFAIIYRGGEKQSITDPALLPDIVVLQSGTLKTLPLYQKKCTMLDALCQAIESWWSNSATPESVQYSREAIKRILDHIESYLQNKDEGNQHMLAASNLAGKAINITTTTAPHAMCYKLTSLYGLPHGHAVALCLPKVWRHMKGFGCIAKALGRQDCEEAVSFLEQLLQELGILPPENAQAADLDVLTSSVNPQRLQNNPVWLTQDTIYVLYQEILGL